MQIEPIKQKTVVAQVMEQIKQLIASGEYKTGDKFPTEYELAEMFGLGRSSIREALKIFQHLGVLESRVPRGTYVCDSSNISKEALTWSILLGNNDFYNLMEFRLVMEQQGLWYLLVLRKDDAEFRKTIVDKLQAEVDSMSISLTRGDYQNRIEADYRFHQHLIEACDNELFNSLYETLHIFIREEMKSAEISKEYKLNSPKRHQDLVDSILEGEYLKATEVFRTHIKNINKVYSKEL